MTIGTWGVIDGGDSQIMDHPALIPATLVVNYEKAGDVGKHIDKGTDVIGVCRQVRLRFKDDTNRANRGQATSGSCSSEHCGVVDALEYCGERIRLKACRIQQVVLKKLTRFRLKRRSILMSFGIRLRR